MQIGKFCEVGILPRRVLWRIRNFSENKSMLIAPSALIVLIFVLMVALQSRLLSHFWNNEKPVKQFQMQFKSSYHKQICGGSKGVKRAFTVNQQIFKRNQAKLRNQLKVWRHVAILINFLNPTFDGIDALHSMYGNLFGRISFCISNRFVARWRNATRKYKASYWLLTYDSYLRSKDDRFYECFGQLQVHLLHDKNIIGVMSVMDDVVLNLWNFGVSRHNDKGISPLLSKIWSMTDGGIFVPFLDTAFSPFFIADLKPSEKGFNEIGDVKSCTKISKTSLKRRNNATICLRFPEIEACTSGKLTAHPWTHYARYFDKAKWALIDLSRSSQIRQSGNVSLTSLIQSTKLFSCCWRHLKKVAQHAFSTTGKALTRNTNIGAVIGEIPSDVVYLPVKQLEDFVQLLKIFRKHSVHAEIAIATSLTCLTSCNKVGFMPLHDAGMLWNETARRRVNDFYDPAAMLPLVHPIKLSQINKDNLLRAMLCQKVFPNFNI